MISRGNSKQKSRWPILALAVMFALTGNVFAQDDSEAEGDEPVDLNRIVVTGSRIKQTDLEGASPVFTITSEEMEQQGFVTVFDALSSITQATGSVQTEAFTNQFTAAAPGINLRGLGPGRTLILINGRRFADYPFPFNGQSNFVNLQRVPTAAVDRIEVLSGGASAIYGSDAVAGVINIITKTSYDGHTITARAGSTADGGGDSYRVQMVGGFDGDRWSAVYALEYFDRDPIFGNDRDYLDERSDFPQLEQVNTRSLLYISDRFGFDLDGDGLSYSDPGAATCDSFVDLEYSFRPPGSGYYCGRDSTGDESIRNQRTHYSVYASLTFEVTDNTQLFAELMWSQADIESTGFRRWWGSGDIWNPLDGTANDQLGSMFIGEPAAGALFQRIFQPAETGPQSSTFDEESFDITVGLRGSFGNSAWDWEGAYHHSEYQSHNTQFYFKEELIDGYFLGTAVPEKDAFGVAFWDVPEDWRERFETPMTPELIDSLSGELNDPADSSVDTVQFVVNNSYLFDLPAGSVGFAGIAEWSTQEYALHPDARTLDKTGNGWWGRSGTGGGGDRDRYAFGAEFSVPVFSKLTLPLAVRYDKYNDKSDVDDAVTWKAGFEYRPLDTLLLRGTIGTSFRAPDMHFLFAGDSGFFTTVRDYYLCRRDEPDVSLPECTNDGVQVAGNRQGNINLEEETGESWTLGFAWEAFENFNLTADLYNIKLEGIVNDLSIDNLLSDEADCRLGVTQGGQPVDGGSVECQRILSRIERNDFPIGTPGAEAINNVTVGPINRSLQEQTGIDVTFDYSYLTERTGIWSLRGSYTHILESKIQEFPEDPIQEDYRNDKQNFEFRHRFTGALGWQMGDWNTVFTAFQKGSVPNWAETDRLDPLWTYNLSVAWAVTDNIVLSAFGNNITNERPPKDLTFDTWPGFWRGSFDAVGRELWAQVNWTFGRN